MRSCFVYNPNIQPSAFSSTHSILKAFGLHRVLQFNYCVLQCSCTGLYFFIVSYHIAPKQQSGGVKCAHLRVQ